MARDRIVAADPGDVNLILGVSPSRSTTLDWILTIVLALASSPLMPRKTSFVQPNLSRMHQPLLRPQQPRTCGI